MDVELPSPERVLALLPIWRADNPRLEAMMVRYGEPVKALRHMGLLLWQQGDFQAATRMLAGAVALAPEEPTLWSGLGGVLFAGGHRLEAASCLKKALDRDPSQPTDWLLLGTVAAAESDKSRAEQAFLEALRLDPCSVDAAISLGLLYTQTRRFAEAAECLQNAIIHGTATAALYTCLAQVLSHLGDFEGAAARFAEAAQLQPEDQKLRLKFAQARFIQTLLKGSFEDGLAAFREAAGQEPEDAQKLAREAFHLLSGYGFVEAAIRLGEARLAQTPDDPIQAYLVAALKQEQIAHAPVDYVISYFDKFADTFDKQLVELLDYHGPEKLHALLRGYEPRPMIHILDLGCGTGLAGPLLKEPGRILTGVDLSPRMLDKAAARQTYDHLIQSEAITYLSGQRSGGIDLIFAADFLVYIGDVTAFLQEAARLLPLGGLLALTIETTLAPTYQLLPSGRFAHRIGYIADLARGSFELRRQEATMIRLEASKPCDGALLLFERV